MISCHFYRHDFKNDLFDFFRFRHFIELLPFQAHSMFFMSMFCRPTLEEEWYKSFKVLLTTSLALFQVYET